MPPLDPTLALTVVGAIASLAGLAVGLWQWFRRRGRGRGLRSEALERAQEAHWNELWKLASGLRMSIQMPDTAFGSYVPFWGGTSVPPEKWSYVLVPFDLLEALPSHLDLDAHLGARSFTANTDRLEKAAEAYWQASKQGLPLKDLEEDAWRAVVRVIDDLEPMVVRRRVIDGKCERCPMPKGAAGKIWERIAQLTARR